MPYTLVRNDITKMKTDAIVNAANTSLLGGGGVDGAIHRAAGPRLQDQCRMLGGCAEGDAKITTGGYLPAKYVIHTVGPIYQDGKHGEREILYSCYRKSLEIAKEHKLNSIAFPLISSGAFGYPPDEALEVATDAITKFLEDNDMDVYMVLYGVKIKLMNRNLYNRIQDYIDENYEEDLPEYHEELRTRRRRLGRACSMKEPSSDSRSLREVSSRYEQDRIRHEKEAIMLQREDPGILSGELGAGACEVRYQTIFRFELDEGFSDKLLRLIKEKGMTETECYKKANIDRKLFSKIRSDKNYRPSKPTVCAFIFALELDMDEAKDMLETAGFALSHSTLFDVIVECFLSEGNHDLYEINQVLCEYDQPLLGSLQLK